MPKAERRKGACCLVSEFLEEAGLDRAKARRLRRQLLEGIILMCQWQLERIPPEPTRASGAPRSRKITVE
jgi:hypothetical protein